MFLGTSLSAFRESEIAPTTIQAYLDTRYQVVEPPGFALRIGRRHRRLSSLLEGERLDGAAVLTAWNPHSQRQSSKANEQAHAALLAEIERRRLPHFPGCGVDADGKWPPEISLLVLGIELATAAKLGKQFHQNGLVWAARDGLPLLVLLR